MEHIGPLKDRLRRYAEAGYDGYEAGFTGMPPEQLREYLNENDLDYVGMVFARDEGELEAQLKVIRRADPILVTCQAGRDHFNFERGLTFFQTAVQLAKDYLDCDLVFETHRQTALFTPWTAARYASALPELRFTADLSHYTCVCETNLNELPHAFYQADNPDILSAAQKPDSFVTECLSTVIKASRHVHARVGHAHGPQVADPTQGEGFEWTKRFEAWWDAIVQACIEEGRDVLTINPEFGPPPYAPADPQTGEPFVDLWATRLWICDRFRRRHPTLISSP